MVLLPDIDGVLVTTPPWRKAELLEDGFLKFSFEATANLNRVIAAGITQIVLSTIHRLNFSIEQWVQLFATRGVFVTAISKVNQIAALAQMPSRYLETEAWVKNNGHHLSILL